MRNREVPRKLNIAVRCAFGFAINCALQSLCVPGHHAVRHEREGSGSSNQLLRSQAAFRWQQSPQGLSAQRPSIRDKP